MTFWEVSCTRPLLAALFFGGVIVPLAGCQDAVRDTVPVIRPVKMYTVTPPEGARSRSFPAVVKAADQSALSFRVAGTLAGLPAREGLQVEKGTILAQLDRRDFESRLAEAQSTLAAAEAELAVLQAGARTEDIAALESQAAAAAAKSANAAAELKRNESLFASGLIARNELERVSTAAEVARQGEESARQELTKARAGARPEEIQASLSRVEAMRAKVADATAALEDTALRAPFDGIVATLQVENFEEVQAKAPILTFQNIGGLLLDMQVPESLVLSRKNGAEFTFEVAFGGDAAKRYPAEVREFSTEADAATQTYRVTVGLDAPGDLVVLPGMTAEIIVTNTSAPTAASIYVPIEAVGAQSDGRPVIWIVDEATMEVHAQSVTTGLLSGASIQIVDGLHEGDTIVTAGLSQLRDGMTVRRLEE